MYSNISNLTSRFFWRKLCTALAAQKTVYRSITASPHGNIDIPNTTLPEFIFESFNKYSNETAVECSLTKRKYTFDQIRIKSRNFNKNLRKKFKLKKGDVIAVMLPNVPEYPICVLGAIQAGLTVSLINPSYKPDEISYQLNDAKVKAIITLGSSFSTAKAATNISKKDIPIFAVNMKQSEATPVGAINLNEFTEAETEIEDVHDINPEDVILLPYSSGTTGLPKGVEITHLNIISNICQVTCDSASHVPQRTENHVNVVPAILPWFHIYGATITLFLHLRQFSKLISVPQFTPDGFIRLLREHNPNLLYLVPPLILFMVSNPAVKPELLQKLTTIISGAAPLGKSDEEKVMKTIGRHIDILQGYGLTETSPALSISTSKIIKDFGNTGSSGFVLPNTLVKIVSTSDPTAEILQTNKQGEILVKGPQVMKRYHNRPEETEQTFLDGWLKTGDLGHFDDNGLLFVTDRLKELIKVKGYQVAPAELEEILRTHKDVSDAGVIGVPDSRSGEVPLAYVVPKSNKNIDVQELHEFMLKKASNYKQLKGGIIVVDSLPKSASGKLLRKELKLQYQKSQNV